MKKGPKKFFKLEYIRKKYGFTQLDFAGLLGLKPSSYSSRVNGRTPITFDEIMILYKIINKVAAKAGDKPYTFEDIFLE